MVFHGVSHHDASRDKCSKIRALQVGSATRALEILLAEWEMSSRTQVKILACARRMAEQTGVHADVIFRTDARTDVPCHALELIVPVLMFPRPCSDRARPAVAPRWHKMGDAQATNAFLRLRINS